MLLIKLIEIGRMSKRISNYGVKCRRRASVRRTLLEMGTPTETVLTPDNIRSRRSSQNSFAI